MRELEQKKEDLQDKVSDKVVAEADAKKDNHLHQHSDLYAEKQLANAKEETTEAKEELARTEQELKEAKESK